MEVNVLVGNGARKAHKKLTAECERLWAWFHRTRERLDESENEEDRNISDFEAARTMRMLASIHFYHSLKKDGDLEAWLRMPGTWLGWKLYGGTIRKQFGLSPDDANVGPWW